MRLLRVLTVSLGFVMLIIGAPTVIRDGLEDWQPWLAWLGTDAAQLILILVGLGLIAVGMALLRDRSIKSIKFSPIQQHDSEPTVVKSKSPADDQPRVFVGPGVTPHYLFELFEGMTDIQAKRVADPFVGMWITVSGRLSNVGQWTGSFSQVTLEKKPLFERERSSDFGDLYMMFRDESWVEKLSVLAPGDPISTPAPHRVQVPEVPDRAAKWGEVGSSRMG